MRSMNNIYSPARASGLTDGGSPLGRSVGNDDEPPAAPAGKAFLTQGAPQIRPFRAAWERA